MSSTDTSDTSATIGPDLEERVILVAPDDRAIGTAGKLRAHREGLLHRALSVFVFDGRGQVLLQRRAADKYHSPDLWSNTACSHPRLGEALLDAAHRRLREEMGIDCGLEHVGVFTYRAELGNGLVEHEVDHLFLGEWSGSPSPNRAEVGEWRWIALPDLLSEMRENPGRFSAWFEPALLALANVERVRLARLDFPATDVGDSGQESGTRD